MRKDEIGSVYGSLTVIGLSEKRQGRHLCWLCQCSCGAVSTVTGYKLRSGRTKCTCSKSRSLIKGRLAEYSSWVHMRKRCNDIGHKNYKNYGGRGIVVCDRWDVFENFYEDMGPRPPGATLDRIDNEIGYEVTNCRWADRRTQDRNKICNVWMEYKGERKVVADWAVELGVPKHRIYSRLKLGWDIHDIINTPAHRAKIPTGVQR